MKNNSYPLHDCHTDNPERKGAASVEFALVAPLLILLILGTIDVGQFVNASETIGVASRVGARSAAKHSTHDISDVKSNIQEYLSKAYPNISADSWDTAIGVNISHSDGLPVTNGNLDLVESGSPLSVEVSLEFGVIRWMTGAGYLNGNEITSSTTMRRE